MLHLKRITNPYQWERCKISKGYIRFGEYYYQDDEDGTIISAKTYADLKRKKKHEEWDYSKLEQYNSERDYEQSMRDAEREYLMSTILDRKVDKGAFNNA